jgi:hypothetical protein
VPGAVFGGRGLGSVVRDGVEVERRRGMEGGQRFEVRGQRLKSEVRGSYPCKERKGGPGSGEMGEHPV